MSAWNKSNILIEKLNLSNRSYNCLKSNGIDTVMDLIVLSKEELNKYRNLGHKSIEEISDTLDKLLSDNYIFEKDENINSKKPTRYKPLLDGDLDKHRIVVDVEYYQSELDFMIIDYVTYKQSPIKKVMFYDNNGYLLDDLNINRIGFSIRATNCLQKNRYKYASQVIRLNISSLREIKNMGRKTLEEIVTKISNISYVIYEDDKNCDTYNDDVEKADFLDYDDYCDKIIEEYRECSVNINVKRVQANIYKILKTNKDFFKRELEIENNIKKIIKKVNTLEIFYTNLFFREIIKKHIYKMLTSHSKLVPLYIVRESLPEHIRNSIIENDIISEMINDKKIELIDNKVTCCYPTLREFINSIKSERERLVLSHRLKRETLEQISNLLNVTRERVRQIEKKALNKKPRIREDDYKELFKKYNWDMETFTKVYDLDSEVFTYLNMVCKKGTDSLEEFLNNKDIPNEIRVKVEKIIYKNYIIIGSSRIKKDKGEILEYVLRTYCKDEITVQRAYDLYYEILKHLDLTDENLICPSRYFESKLANSKNVLWKFRKKLRYYDFENISIDEIINGLNLKQYKDVEYSTLKFFNEYLDLMKEWDIRDEYELHNLMKKKFVNEINIDIKFLRMPNVEFGIADRDMQVLDLLIQNAPVENEKLAKIYEEEYGVRAETALANYFKCIGEYCHNSIYSIDSKPFISEDLNLMKNAFTKDFYLITEVKDIFKKLFPKGDVSLINPYNLKCMGFKVNSNSIYSDNYTSCEQYFRALILKDDIFDANVLGNSIYSNQTYYHVIQAFKEEFEILEFSYNKFINIRRLQKIGIGKNELKEFCNDIYSFANEEIFTIEFLRKNGFEHRLYELGFDDWFYSSLLKYDSRFNYRRLEGTILFRKGKSMVTISDLIEYLVYHFKSIDIYDFIDFVFKEYGINVDCYKIQNTVKESGMYYDSIMEKIYIDYNEYFEEV